MEEWTRDAGLVKQMEIDAPLDATDPSKGTTVVCATLALEGDSRDGFRFSREFRDHLNGANFESGDVIELHQQPSLPDGTLRARLLWALGRVPEEDSADVSAHTTTTSDDDERDELRAFRARARRHTLAAEAEAEEAAAGAGRGGWADRTRLRSHGAAQVDNQRLQRRASGLLALAQAASSAATSEELDTQPPSHTETQMAELAAYVRNVDDRQKRQHAEVLREAKDMYHRVEQDVLSIRNMLRALAAAPARAPTAPAAAAAAAEGRLDTEFAALAWVLRSVDLPDPAIGGQYSGIFRSSLPPVIKAEQLRDIRDTVRCGGSAQGRAEALDRLLRRYLKSFGVSSAA